jgi:uncharacterized protein YjiS (DUF1127 family)
MALSSNTKGVGQSMRSTIGAGSLENIRQWLVELSRYFVGSSRSRIRQLEALRELDDRLLEDVGVSRGEARLGYRARSCDFSDRRLKEFR